MSKGILNACVFTFVLLCVPHAQSESYRTDRLIVAPRAGTELQFHKLRTLKNHRVRHHLPEFGVDVLEIPAGSDPVATANEYRASGLVEWAEPDYRIHVSAVPNDPSFSKCWGMNNTGQSDGTAHADIGAERAWSTQTSASNIVVAVIDSGIRYTHEDLAPNLWRNSGEIDGNGVDDDGDGIVDDIYGYNAVDGSGDPWDDFGHGTHVAGIIGAAGNNGKGVAGVCWNVQLMALKFLASDGSGDTSDAIFCIHYAQKHGAKVINASWASPQNSLGLKSAINSARSAGIIFVCAAGNDGANNDSTGTYPANFNLDNVISVAAVDRYGQLDSSYSNYGAASVDLAAPGTQIYSTSNQGDNQYQYMTGTSMAAPHVTGAIALLRAAYPGDSYTATIQRLLAAVQKVPSLTGKCVTGGYLNVGNAFPPVSAAGTGTPRITAITRSVSGNIELAIANSAPAAIVESSADLWTWSVVDGVTQIGNTISVPSAETSRSFYRLRNP